MLPDNPAALIGLSSEAGKILVLPLESHASAGDDPGVWRIPYVAYLRNPSARTDRKFGGLLLSIL